MRLPINKLSLLKDISDASRRLGQGREGDPALDEIAAELDMPADQIADAMIKKNGSLEIISWKASTEFLGSTYKPKPLNAWEKYVQVLLLSNEIAFVD